MEERTQTGSVETRAEPRRVLMLLADAGNLPDWAPDFADRVDGSPGSGWEVVKDDERFELGVVVNREAGTVDYLREIAPGRVGGAFVRVTPRPGGGSVVVMTLPVAPEADGEAIGAVLDTELAALVALLDS